MTRTIFALVGGLLLLGAASGCATADDHVVGGVAERFYAAVSDGDGAAACTLLAPRTKAELEESAGKACAQAILEEDIPDSGDRRSTQVFGTMAEVGRSGDTAFLAEFADGWKVMAVGCTARENLPYDCEVSG